MDTFTLTNEPSFSATVTNDDTWPVVDALPPLFEVTDGCYTVMLENLLPDWGEGDSEAAAVKDLAEGLWSLHNDLHDWPDDRLAPHLRHQRDFLCTLARAFGKHR